MVHSTIYFTIVSDSIIFVNVAPNTLPSFIKIQLVQHVKKKRVHVFSTATVAHSNCISFLFFQELNMKVSKGNEGVFSQ